MKRIILGIWAFLSLFTFSSCNDWLDILPSNEQVTDNYWKSKEDVEAVVTSGYYYMRSTVPQMLIWGEVRGGTLFSNNSADVYLQNFNLNPSHSIVNYTNVYKVISMANSVLKYAPSVREIDDTYFEPIMNSHLVEAYFMRAYSYFLLVKNFRDVPLVLDAYVNDDASYELPKSTEAEIIEQIKKDILAALETGAAKEKYEIEWQTKGRATVWALYALMADVCLWSEDYEESIVYANNILNATAAFRPVFMQDPLKWFDIFYPGNSNESIMELNWDNTTYQQNNNFGGYFNLSSGSRLRFTDASIQTFKDETDEIKKENPTLDGRLGRTLMGSYVHSGAAIADYTTANQFYVWKYKGTDVADRENLRTAEDANFILYRVAEVLLIKAEALILQGPAYWPAALEIINQVRERTYLPAIELETSEADELTLLELVLHEREMEFVGEGKRWYDLLRFGRMQSFKYKEQFITKIVSSNQTTNPQWIKSVLKSEDAWYMPIPESEIQTNPLLEQNPYYATTK